MTALGVREAARRIGVHENTVRNMAADGRIEVAGVMPGSGYMRFVPEEVERVRQEVIRDGGLRVQRASRLELRAALRRLAAGWEETAAVFSQLSGEPGADQAARAYRRCARQVRGLLGGDPAAPGR